MNVLNSHMIDMEGVKSIKVVATNHEDAQVTFDFNGPHFSDDEIEVHAEYEFEARGWNKSVCDWHITRITRHDGLTLYHANINGKSQFVSVPE